MVHTCQSRFEQLENDPTATVLQENISATTDEGISAQECEPVLRGSQSKIHDRSYEAETLGGGQEYRVQDEGQPHESQEDRQEDGAHENRFDDHTTGEGRNADGAREDVHEDAAQNDEREKRVSEEVQQFHSQKRQVTSDESDEDEALRAWERRKPMEKGKYQRLNKFGPSNSNMAQENDMSMVDTGETSVPGKKSQTQRRKQRQELQLREKTRNSTAATVAEDKNTSFFFYC